MLNTASTEELSRLTGDYIFPDFGAYCFAGIPGSIQKFLTGSTQFATLPESVFDGFEKTYDKVVLLFVDAFGWQHLDRLSAACPAFERLLEGSRVSKLTSMFPSATTVHVTASRTALTPKQSGFLEWCYYDVRLGDMFCPLLFSSSRNAYGASLRRETLRGLVDEPGKVYPPNNYFQNLAAAGVPSIFVGPKFIENSTYNCHTMTGVREYPFNNEEHGFDLVCEALRATPGKLNISYYIAALDSLMHRTGPNSAATLDWQTRYFELLEKKLIAPLRNLGEKALLIVTADHGHDAVTDEETIWIEDFYPKIVECTRENRHGEKLWPSGGRRDPFLYIKPDRVDEVAADLTEKLEGIARVYKGKEAQDLFGPDEASSVFKANAPDIVLLTKPGAGIFWRSTETIDGLIGRHGGVSPNEMFIPCIVSELG